MVAGVATAVEVELPAANGSTQGGMSPDSPDPGAAQRTPWIRGTRMLSMISSVSFFLFGYDTGIVSGAMLKIGKAYRLRPFEHELVVSATIGLAVVGSSIGGRLTSRFGRRPVIHAASLVFTVGALVMAVAPPMQGPDANAIAQSRATGLACLLIGRMVLGLAIGLSTASVPMYVAEACLPAERGKMVTSNALTIPVGQFIACVLAGVLADVPGGWRWMLGLGALPSALQLVAFTVLPESPRWLASHGRTAEAAMALGYLRDLSSTDRVVTEEVAALAAAAKEEERSGPAVSGCANRSPAFKRALLVGGGLQLLQQSVGINTVMYYSATILQMGGLGASEGDKDVDGGAGAEAEASSHADAVAIWGAAVIGLTNALGAWVGVRLVESSGRRALVLTSLAVVIAALMMLALAFDLLRRDAVPTAHAGIVTLVALVAYIAGFSPGMGTMPWTINSEIYAQEDRSLGTSVSSALNWTGNLVISLTFLDLCELLTEAGAFSLYAAIGVVGWVFIFTLLPETKGKSLEEVVALFGNDAPRARCCAWGSRGHGSNTQGSTYVEFMRDDSVEASVPPVTEPAHPKGAQAAAPDASKLENGGEPHAPTSGQPRAGERTDDARHGTSGRADDGPAEATPTTPTEKTLPPTPPAANETC